MLPLAITCLIALILAVLAVVTSNRLVRIAALLTTITLFCYIGYGVGRALEYSRCYDNYIYWFSKYSDHLHTLVDERNISELTNNIILFDTKFSSHKDTHTLQDVMYEILKVGPYSQADTNVAVVAATNTVVPKGASQ